MTTDLVLVTGGGGFLGGHIVDKLLARGNGVRVFGRRAYPGLSARGVDCRQGDLADAEAVGGAVKGVDAVIHAAAIPGVWGDYRKYYLANYVGARNVIDAARRHGVRKIVYTSTPSVVHGGHSLSGGDESLPYPDQYLTPYAATKALAEKLVLASNGADLATLAVRPHLIFGPRDTQLVPKLLERAKTGKLKRIGPGKNLVSVSYVENVADAHLAALDRLEPGAAVAGQAYFINEPEPVNCWDFINRIVTGMGLRPITREISPRLAYAAGWLCEKVFEVVGEKGDPPLTRFLVTQLSTDHWFRVDKARRELGWEPAVSIEDGLAGMLKSMRA